MMSFALGTWIWTLTGGAVIAAGVVAIVFFVRGDRSRGRRRCPRCWYDMRGIDGVTCPECGRDAPSESALLRTRRRWATGVLGVAFCIVGWQLVEQPRRSAEGLTRLVPTALLILGAQDTDASGAEPAPWRVRMAAAVTTRPMPGWMRAIAEARMLRLTQADVEGMFAGRWAWRDSAPPVAILHVPSGVYPSDLDTQRTLTVRRVGSTDELEMDAAAIAGFSMSGMPSAREERWHLQERPVGDYRDEVIVELRNETGWRIGRWRVEIASRVSASLNDIVPPVDSPEIRRELVSGLMIQIGRGRKDFLVYLPDRPPPLGPVPIAGEVLVDGKLSAILGHAGDFTLPPTCPGSPTSGSRCGFAATRPRRLTLTSR